MAAARFALIVSFLAAFGGGLVYLNPLASRPAPAPEVGSLPAYSFPTANALTGWDDPRLQRDASEQPLVFARRLTRVVGEAIYHCEDPIQTTFFAKISDRFLKLRTIGTLSPEFLRCGLCHQVATILTQALQRGGVEASVYGLNGHVVTRFIVNGDTYISDPDLDVGPFEVKDLSSVELARAASRAYKDLGRRGGVKETEGWISDIIERYRSVNDNVVVDNFERLKDFEERQEVAFRIIEWLSEMGFYLIVASVVLALMGMIKYCKDWLRQPNV